MDRFERERMSNKFAKEFVLKDGRRIIVRQAQLADSEGFLRYGQEVFKDDRYFLTTQEEAKEWWSIEKTTERIKGYVDQKGKVLLVAVVNGMIVGQIQVECGAKRRTRHVGQIGMSILDEYRGIGVGTALMESIIAWAKEDGIIEKLALSVFATNKGAIGLYEKMGFEEEGREIRRIRLAKRKYVDTVLMYKFVK